jgi:hypothetical protein
MQWIFSRFYAMKLIQIDFWFEIAEKRVSEKKKMMKQIEKGSIVISLRVCSTLTCALNRHTWNEY